MSGGSATRRRPAIACAMLAMLALSAVGAAADDEGAVPSIDSVGASIAETESRLEALDAELAGSRRERQALERKLAEAEARADERRGRVAGLDADIAEFEATLATLEGRVAAERETLERRRELLGDSLRGARRVGSDSALKLLLEQDDPALADRLLVWTGYLARAQRATIERQADAVRRIEAARARASKDRNWLGYIRRKASGQRDVQLSASSASRSALGEVESRITETTRSVATLRADAGRLQGLMQELEAAQATGSGYFEAGKGGWPLPVAGEIDARFGDVKLVGRLTWNGMFIRADAGVPVTSVADGEVVYSDWLQGFGMLVIVDHGDGWMTLYGGNRDVTRAVGSWVESGATVATVGDSGGQNESGVYFEIRKDARPVDPAAWVAGADARG